MKSPNLDTQKKRWLIKKIWIFIKSDSNEVAVTHARSIIAMFCPQKDTTSGWCGEAKPKQWAESKAKREKRKKRFLNITNVRHFVAIAAYFSIPLLQWWLCRYGCGLIWPCMPMPVLQEYHIKRNTHRFYFIILFFRPSIFFWCALSVSKCACVFLYVSWRWFLVFPHSNAAERAELMKKIKKKKRKSGSGMKLREMSHPKDDGILSVSFSRTLFFLPYLFFVVLIASHKKIFI